MILYDQIQMFFESKKECAGMFFIRSRKSGKTSVLVDIFIFNSGYVKKIEI